MTGLCRLQVVRNKVLAASNLDRDGEETAVLKTRECPGDTCMPRQYGARGRVRHCVVRTVSSDGVGIQPYRRLGATHTYTWAGGGQG